ncbi:MAG: FAD-binding protein, partial [Clostridia bacterium]|nr:FAD-binding protein [Clostridia bacterium]
MIRITGVRLEITESEDDLIEKVRRKYNLKNVSNFTITKKSVDARKKNDIHYVYAVDLCTANEDALAGKYKEIQKAEHKTYVFPEGVKPDKPIVIAGMGPAGLLCALTLVQNGYKVIVLERGKRVDERKKDVDAFWETGVLNPSSNVQFGEGGAGTFSDGKLT